MSATKTDQPKINQVLSSIIILCHNKWQFTKDCIEQVLSITSPELYELIIVDNSSTDETRNYLLDVKKTTESRRIRLLINNENLGFVGGNNQALKLARGKYIVFLNNDTKPRKGWLEALITTMEKNPAVGAVGAKLVYPDGRLQEAGGIIYHDGTGCNYGKFENPELPQFNYLREVDYCSGACLAVRTDLFRNIGGFDERYSPAYYEDTDLCFSVRARGFRVMYQPAAVVEHFEGATAGIDIKSGVKRFQEVNRTKFIDKWHTQLKEQGPPPSNVFELTKAAERSRGKKILFAHEIPQAYDRASGALRIHNLMRLLVEHDHHVTYVCLNSKSHDGIDLAPYISNMQSMGVYVVPLDRFKNPDTEFCRMLALQDFDSAYLPFYYSAQRFIPMIRDMSPRTHIVMDSIDVHFLRNARQMLLEGTPNTWVTFSSAKNQELAAYKLADAVLTVTEKDRDILQKHLPFPPVFSVSDPHNSRTQTPGFAERRDLMFLAGFKHTPNVDAAIFFHKEIWPLVLEKLPDIRWYILGDSPPPEILALECDNVIVTGYVEHLEPYLHKARVAIAPLRFGAGMKGKIACSLAHGLPCVSTAIGSEGMGLIHGESVMVAENPVEFSDAIHKLYTHEPLWETMSLAGKEVLNRRFGDSVIYPSLAGALGIENPKTKPQIDSADQVAAASQISHGYRLMGYGLTDISEIVFMRCLEALPGNPNVMAGLALAQAKQNKPKEALSTMVQALEASQTHSLHLAYLAVIFKLSGNYDKALEAFIAAHDRDSANPWIVGEFASYLKYLAQSDTGIQLMTRYAGNDRDIISPLVQQASLSEKVNDFKGSSETLKAAMQVAKSIGDEISCKKIGLRINTLIDNLDRINKQQAAITVP